MSREKGEGSNLDNELPDALAKNNYPTVRVALGLDPDPERLGFKQVVPLLIEKINELEPNNLEKAYELALCCLEFLRSNKLKEPEMSAFLGVYDRVHFQKIVRGELESLVAEPKQEVEEVYSRLEKIKGQDEYTSLPLVFKNAVIEDEIQRAQNLCQTAYNWDASAALLNLAQVVLRAAVPVAKHAELGDLNRYKLGMVEAVQKKLHTTAADFRKLYGFTGIGVDQGKKERLEEDFEANCAAFKKNWQNYIKVIKDKIEDRDANHTYDSELFDLCKEYVVAQKVLEQFEHSKVAVKQGKIASPKLSEVPSYWISSSKIDKEYLAKEVKYIASVIKANRPLEEVETGLKVLHLETSQGEWARIEKFDARRLLEILKRSLPQGGDAVLQIQTLLMGVKPHLANQEGWEVIRPYYNTLICDTENLSNALKSGNHSDIEYFTAKLSLSTAVLDKVEGGLSNIGDKAHFYQFSAKVEFIESLKGKKLLNNGEKRLLKEMLQGSNGVGLSVEIDALEKSGSGTEVSAIVAQARGYVEQDAGMVENEVVVAKGIIESFSSWLSSISASFSIWGRSPKRGAAGVEDDNSVVAAGPVNQEAILPTGTLIEEESLKLDELFRTLTQHYRPQLTRTSPVIDVLDLSSIKPDQVPTVPSKAIVETVSQQICEKLTSDLRRCYQDIGSYVEDLSGQDVQAQGDKATVSLGGAIKLEVSVHEGRARYQPISVPEGGDITLVDKNTNVILKLDHTGKALAVVKPEGLGSGECKFDLEFYEAQIREGNQASINGGNRPVRRGGARF